MHPELMRQVAMARMAGFQRDAIRYRQAREGYSRPPQTVRAAIELRLSACREELERLALLSERPLHEGDWLVADVDGVAVAAVSVEDLARSRARWVSSVESGRGSTSAHMVLNKCSFCTVRNSGIRVSVQGTNSRQMYAVNRSSLPRNRSWEKA